ncbi:MAG: hypothetical protein KBB55_00135 [Candidatus Buchananbacteria bacterium]|nr:hypothetical protein [Candidatus Buchananbacteria bacterium]
MSFKKIFKTTGQYLQTAKSLPPAFVVAGLLLLLFSLVAVATVNAAVMSSPSYELEADSINIGGDELASSSQYLIQDTVGEAGTGASTGGAYSIEAGYRSSIVNTFISMSDSGDFELSPPLGGITGGTANGSTTVSVLTNNPSGYALYIKTETTPALTSDTDEISDYVPAGAVPDYNFSIPSAAAVFGFSPEGADIVADFLDDGNDCGVGSSDAVDRCWQGLDTVDQLIASRPTSNNPTPSETVIKFQVGIDSGRNLTAEIYRATTTVTAIEL